MNFLELLICAKAGDNEAAERILTMYQPRVVRTSAWPNSSLRLLTSMPVSMQRVANVCRSTWKFRYRMPHCFRKPLK